MSAMETEEFFGILTTANQGLTKLYETLIDGNARKDVIVDLSMEVTGICVFQILCVNACERTKIQTSVTWLILPVAYACPKD